MLRCFIQVNYKKTTASSAHYLMCLFDFLWYDLPIIPGIRNMGDMKINSKCLSHSGRLIKKLFNIIGNKSKLQDNNV